MPTTFFEKNQDQNHSIRLSYYHTVLTVYHQTKQIFYVTIRGPIFTESGSESRVSGIRIQNKDFSDQNIKNLQTLTRFFSELQDGL